MEDAFFGISPYHVLLVGCGLVIILAFWFPRFLRDREPSSSGLLILGGLAVFGILPGVPEVFSPMERTGFWELASEFAVIAALFGTGMRLDKIVGKGLWAPTIRLLVIAMPLCIAAVFALGYALGLTAAGAILLAAVLAPTDPVLAADVQVGPPGEGGEHPIRYALTTEAGLNDGLAFPFVYLALFVGTLGLNPGDWGWEWFSLYLVYKIAVGGLAGVAAGWVLGRVIFHMPRHNPLSDGGTGVIALAGLLFTYGMTELIEGYGFIAAFVMGLTLRRVEVEHEYHTRLHAFSEALEQAVTAILLVLFGGALPVLLPYLSWQHALIGVALIFVIRPAFGMLSLIGTVMPMKHRGVVAFYGVRGIGSIYYLAYAAGSLDFVNEGDLWAAIAFTIVLSTLVHGFSAGSVVHAVTRTEKREAAPG
ncbi:cation:proton antiporter [Croceicoccus naphthovorans]|uniref:Sodium:proton antiporter n=1 Tax=Croceicoccus naphthovorans TaxID=1348774 RepID=A0A0G3XJQ8_9SPHN|nr:cation:proton antiporter [Croceicoccus naphthovorans]AKM10834.1 sodium:proton antiporter [Croceicoccus naphthovorans]MBB3989051.1 NhaP-type Na+/H+ or K+/H+ antiporter [Croceicoccus naphthovorans]